MPDPDSYLLLHLEFKIVDSLSVRPFPWGLLWPKHFKPETTRDACVVPFFAHATSAGADREVNPVIAITSYNIAWAVSGTMLHRRHFSGKRLVGSKGGCAGEDPNTVNLNLNNR